MKNLTYQKIKKIKMWIGISILILCSFVFLILFTSLIKPLKYFLLGTFGLFAYPLFITIFFVGLALINKRRYYLPIRYLAYIVCAILSILAIIQNIVVGDFNGGFFEFLGYNYTKQLTPGGIIIGIIISPVKFSLGSAGVYAIFAILLVIFVCLIIDYLLYVKRKAKENMPIRIQKQKEILLEKKNQEKIENKIKTNISDKWIIDKEGNLIGKDGEIFVSESKKEKGNKQKNEKPKITLDAKIEEQEENNKNITAKQKLGLYKNGIIEQSDNIKKEPTLRERFERNELTKKEYLLTPPKLTEMAIFNNKTNNKKISEESFYDEIQQNIESLKNSQKYILSTQTNIDQNKEHIEDLQKNDSNINIDNANKNYDSDNNNISNSSNFVDFEEESNFNNAESKAVAGDIIEKMLKDEPNINISAEKLKPAVDHKKINKNKKYIYPTFDLLNDIINNDIELQESVQKKAVILENALETFNINAKVIRIVVGPSVTRYELEMPVGVPIKKILSHQDDIALNLASNGDIRIEAPIPGRSAVGIEVPNDKISTIGIKEILMSKEFQDAKSPLSFALGKEISGEIRICNLAKMPHLLIAGATGSGKSVCLNTIIISMLYKASPEDIKLILIDPKRVEFSMYNGLPHLMLPNVITETDKAVNALTWAINEMERRFSIFQEKKARNLDEYNNTQDVLSGESEKLPLIVIIIDELADLMMLAKKDIEEKIMRLAQKARAAGIHLILATQRPSVNVITGTIKANFPSRIAFAVTSYVDSKTILDSAGAEKLLGKGDMLYAPSDQAEPTRIQGCYIDGKEVENVVNFIKENNNYDFDLDVAKEVVTSPKGYAGNPFGHNPEQSDELLPYALKLFIENGQASITMLQRRFRIGFSRAANLVDEMEQKGYVGPAEGSKQRQVFLTMEEFKEIFGEID